MQTKYDAQTLETGRRLQSDAFDDRLALRESLDPHFTQLWLDLRTLVITSLRMQGVR